MLAERLKELREDKKITQRALAGKIGVTQQAVAKWESGQTEPDTATIAKLANIFGVTSDYLLGITNNQDPRELPDTVAPYLPEGFDELCEEVRKEILDFIDYVMHKYKKED